MKVSVNRKSLQRNMQRVQSIAGASLLNPILEYVVIKATENELLFRTTNLSISTKAIIPIGEELSIEEQGEVAVVAADFAKIVKELPNEDMATLFLKDTYLHIVCGKTKIKVCSLAPDDFPAEVSFDTVTQFVVDKSIFEQYVARLGFATTEDRSRYLLSGIKLETKEDNISFVATDGKRLCYDVLDCCSEKPIDALVHTRTLEEIRKFDQGDITVRVGEKSIAFESATYCVYSQLLCGTFPEYKQLIPRDYEYSVAVNTGELIKSVKRSSLLADERTMTVDFSFDKGELVVSSRSQSLGDSNNVLEYLGEIVPMKCSYRWDFLLDVLTVIDAENVTLCLQNNERPLLIQDSANPSFLCVLMPVKQAREETNER